MPRGGPWPNSGGQRRRKPPKRAKLLALSIRQGPQITSRQFLDGLMRGSLRFEGDADAGGHRVFKASPEPSPAAAVSPPIQPQSHSPANSAFRAFCPRSRLLIPSCSSTRRPDSNAHWNTRLDSNHQPDRCENRHPNLMLIASMLLTRRHLSQSRCRAPMDPAPNVTKLRGAYVKGARPATMHRRRRVPWTRVSQGSNAIQLRHGLSTH